MQIEEIRELSVQTRWVKTVMVILQIPTWVGIYQIWQFLATIASRLPK